MKYLIKYYFHLHISDNTNKKEKSITRRRYMECLASSVRYGVRLKILIN